MNMKKFLPLLLVPLAVSCASDKDSIDLSGNWAFSTDSLSWNNNFILPGSTSTNNMGEDISLDTDWTGLIVDSSYFKNEMYERFRQEGNIKIPFWLQPDKYYKGTAWYMKEIDIPESWKGESMILVLERPHWQSEVYINGKLAGKGNSLGTPHRFDLTEHVTTGKNVLTVKIDNRINDIDPGVSSHSICDHTQTNWNGIAGQIALEKKPPVYIRYTEIHPDADKKEVRVNLKVFNSGDKSRDMKYMLKLSTGETVEGIYSAAPGEDSFGVKINVESPIERWDEHNPALYSLETTLTDPATKQSDTRKERFGFRDLKAENGRLTINGRQIFLRGTLDCAAFPKTGFPPTDKESWIKEFQICKDYGLNHVRFHSWCPPKAAFEAADELGIYIEAECSSWPNQTVTLGDGKPIDNYIIEEGKRMLAEYGNHPSFCMMMSGNEPGGARHSEYLSELVSSWKAADPRRLYSTSGGWPNLPVNDFLSDPAPRIQGWGQELKSIINGKRPENSYDWSEYTGKFNQPMVSHEIGQWCVYPDFREIEKYDGVVKARNFEIFRETLSDNGLLQLADSFVLASGKLQTLCYKADIEAALRTKDFGGFQMLGLSDFPGQGTALVGILNAFWENKGYVTSSEFKEFCNSTVPLARMEKFIYSNTENLEADIEIAHYGQAPLMPGKATWKLEDKSGNTVAEGSINHDEIGIGNCIEIGKIDTRLDAVTHPSQLQLAVNIGGYVNRWDIWVYPENTMKDVQDNLAGIYMTDKLDKKAADILENGGTVLLSLKKGTLSEDFGGSIKAGFSSIFWNTAWTLGQAPHTLGILCSPEHSALKSFPTEYHSNYQWWDAMSNCGTIEYTKLSASLKPIVRVIDDWFTNRPLALIVEAKAGKGQILISGVDFWQDMENRPEARQLLISLSDYMNSSDFNPDTEVAISEIQKITD